MLSVIARIFDPLGLFVPTVFFAKCIMQRTWQSKLAWDAPLPPDIRNDWSKFMSELAALSSLRIPHYLNTAKGTTCALLCFCDASTRGYAAVVYIRGLNAPREESVVLVGTKTKLAPLKPQTVPRLELNATVLLTRWLQRVKAILTIVDVYAWSDSSTVLSWLNTPHSTFKVYVSNRIHLVLSLLPECRWWYVKSELNPADCASRGVRPTELPHKTIYWQGPDFLRDENFIGIPLLVH